ncbi:MAG: hypothetical protein ACLQU1_36600 [Bryobacteraceae bacterium]
MDSPLILTRRRALLIAGTGLIPWTRLYAGEFWDKKDPAQWTPDEKDKMLTKSPWAKEVSAQATADPNQQQTQYPNNGGYGYPGGGYPGGMGGGRRMGGPGMGRGRYPGQGMQSYKGTVRWESAPPIMAAAPPPMPDGFDEKHYVISTVGFPDLGTPQRRYNDDSESGSGSNRSSGDLDKQFVDELKQYTILQPKGRDLAQAGIVKRKLGNYYFGFSKELLNLDTGEHEVDFATRIGRLSIKAKFNMKEMMYKRKLAI